MNRDGGGTAPVLGRRRMLADRLAATLYGWREAPSDRRPDIQALRALAVGVVVVNHFWPARMTGGYVGVDVFFVISGFLITTHLVKELDATGRISLKQFYARRVRRLLPAALLVLAVSVVLVRILLPYSRWLRNAAEIVSSGFYVENWFLAARSVNYSALNDTASVAQHYWSLSVEEQFYLLWPVLLIGLWWLARKTGSSSLRVGLIGMAVVVASALAFGVWYTSADPAPAYFVTPVRFWEFALGGALALVARRAGRRPATPTPRWVNTCLQLAAVVGFGLIVWSAFRYTHVTPFPGWRAVVPAVGTAMVIAAGTVLEHTWHSWLTSLRPAQYIGDISYSLYLWHWPIVVVAPFAFGHAPGGLQKAGLVCVALLFAGLSKRFVEDPLRTWRWLQAPVRRTYVAMMAGMTVIGVLGACLVVNQWATAADIARQRTSRADDPCAGPLAMGNPACPDPFGPAVDPVTTEANNAYWLAPTDPQCASETRADGRTIMVCDFSQGTDSTKVTLLGDSHAQQWQYALLPLAKQRHWILTMTYLGACPTADVTYVGYRGTPATPEKIAECKAWRDAERDLAASDGTDTVFISFFAREEQVDDGSGRTQTDQYATGLTSYVAPLLAAGVKVYVIGDPPYNAGVRDPDCALLRARNPIACAVPRSVAQPPDPLLEAAHRSGGTIRPIDLTDKFCDQRLCYAVVGGIPVYYDLDHLNREYVSRLAAAIDAQLDVG